MIEQKKWPKIEPSPIFFATGFQKSHFTLLSAGAIRTVDPRPAAPRIKLLKTCMRVLLENYDIHPKNATVKMDFRFTSPLKKSRYEDMKPLKSEAPVI